VKESLDFSKAADQLGIMFVSAYYTGVHLVDNPQLVIAGCLLYLALTVFTDRMKRSA
jgi:hypothetical protein